MVVLWWWLMRLEMFFLHFSCHKSSLRVISKAFPRMIQHLCGAKNNRTGLVMFLNQPWKLCVMPVPCCEAASWEKRTFMLFRRKTEVTKMCAFNIQHHVALICTAHAFYHLFNVSPPSPICCPLPFLNTVKMSKQFCVPVDQTSLLALLLCLCWQCSISEGH